MALCFYLNSYVFIGMSSISDYGAVLVRALPIGHRTHVLRPLGRTLSYEEGGVDDSSTLFGFSTFLGRLLIGDSIRIHSSGAPGLRNFSGIHPLFATYY